MTLKINLRILLESPCVTPNSPIFAVSPCVPLNLRSLRILLFKVTGDYEADKKGTVDDVKLNAYKESKRMKNNGLPSLSHTTLKCEVNDNTRHFVSSDPYLFVSSPFLVPPFNRLSLGATRPTASRNYSFRSFLTILLPPFLSILLPPTSHLCPCT